jgi:PKD repeat protein
MGNHCIRKITPAGVVTTLAGSLNPGNWNGTGAAAAFQSPTGLGWYNATDLLIADPVNANVRKVNVLTKVVTNIAGTGSTGNADGDTSVATFTSPMDVTTDNSKNIYVVDGTPGSPGSANLIRKVTGSCVTTFAGSAGVADTTNGTGSAARFNTPSGITFYNGALYVADMGNNILRKVTVPGTPADAPPYAYFANVIRVGNDTNTFTLIDSSVTVTNSRAWHFYPSTVTYVSGDSTSAQPRVKFTAPGYYTISLTVRNCWGSNTLTRTNYINIHHVGINEVHPDMSVSVYPNPSSGKFEIALSNTTPELIIHVMDINGKLLLEQKVTSSKETIDLGGFAKGIYLMQISGKDTSINQKLVVE